MPDMTTIDDLRRRAWDTAGPESVLAELRANGHRLLPMEGGRLQVDPPPRTERLGYLCRRHKASLLELLAAERQNDPWDPAAAEAVTGHVLTLYRTHGWPEEEPWRSKVLELAGAVCDAVAWEDLPALRRARDGVEKLYRELDRQTAEVDRSAALTLSACGHERAGYFLVKSDLGTAVRKMCPDCGRRLNAGDDAPRGRKVVPAWPADGPADPDAGMNELVAWWASVEAAVTDGMTVCPAVTVLEACRFRRVVNDQIADWKLGDPAPGLEAKLATMRKGWAA